MDVQYRQLIEKSFLAATAAIAAVEDDRARTKQDGSPVTEADLAAAAAIRAVLQDGLPRDHVIIDEESFADEAAARPDWSGDTTYWFIDPVAGTSAYMNRLPFYASAIGAIRQGTPVAGGVCFPALREMHISDADGARHYKRTSDDGRWEQNQLGAGTVAPKKMFYHHGASAVDDAYDIKKLCKGQHEDGSRNKADDLLLMELPVISFGLFNIAAGRCTAGVFHPYVWDLAASMALLQKAGIGVYDIENKKELTHIDDAWVSDAMRFRNPLLVCAPQLRDAMMTRFQRAQKLPRP